MPKVALATLSLVAALAAVTTLATAHRATASASRSCGVERWDVKTLSDPAAGKVNFMPTRTTVATLRALPRPTGNLGGRRNPTVERTTYRVVAALIEAKIEDDRDIHLVVADPRHRNRTMIVELPSTGC